MRAAGAHRPDFRAAAVWVVLVCLGAAAGCSRHDEPAATAAMEVSGTPGETYERVLARLRPLLAENTKIVRVDEPDALMMRFSLRGRDDSVRLVEAVLRGSDRGGTTVIVRSERFHFLPGGRRDTVDSEIEAAVTRLFSDVTEEQR